jgi:hypothetical protein
MLWEQKRSPEACQFVAKKTDADVWSAKVFHNSYINKHEGKNRGTFLGSTTEPEIFLGTVFYIRQNLFPRVDK